MRTDTFLDPIVTKGPKADVMVTKLFHHMEVP